MVRLEDDSETGGDHDDDPSGSRQPVTGRGRHFAVWDDREIDVVVEPFAGNPGYRGQPLGGQGDEDQDDEGEGGNGHRRHVEPIMVWRQFFTEDLIVCLVIETNRYATLLGRGFRGSEASTNIRSGIIILGLRSFWNVGRLSPGVKWRRGWRWRTRLAFTCCRPHSTTGAPGGFSKRHSFERSCPGTDFSKSKHVFTWPTICFSCCPISYPK